MSAGGVVSFGSFTSVEVTYDVSVAKGQKYPDVHSILRKHVGKERTERGDCVL